MGKVIIETNDFDLSLGGNGGGGSSAVLEPLSITKNGEYTPSEGVDGFSSVVANVTPDTEVVGKTVTKNGTYIIRPQAAEAIESVRFIVSVPDPPSQIKSVTLTENGTHTIKPDLGFLLSSANVTVNVPTPTVPTETKSVTISKNGTTLIAPSSGKYLTNVTVITEVDAKKSVGEVINAYLKAGGKFAYGTFSDGVPFTDNNSIYTGVTDLTNLFRNCTFSGGAQYGASVVMNYMYLDANTTNLTFMFQDCTDIATVYLPNLANVKYMNGMFMGCKMLTTVNVGEFNFSNVVSMTNMFQGCTKLGSGKDPFDAFDIRISNVRDLAYMFYDCYSLTILDLTKWTASNVTDMRMMFGGCSSIKSLIGTNDIDDIQENDITVMLYCGRSTDIVDWRGLTDYLRYSSLLALAKGLQQIVQIDGSSSKKSVYYSKGLFDKMREDNDTVPTDALIETRQKNIKNIISSKGYTLKEFAS